MKTGDFIDSMTHYLSGKAKVKNGCIVSFHTFIKLGEYEERAREKGVLDETIKRLREQFKKLKVADLGFKGVGKKYSYWNQQIQIWKKIWSYSYFISWKNRVKKLSRGDWSMPHDEETELLVKQIKLGKQDEKSI